MLRLKSYILVEIALPTPTLKIAIIDEKGHMTTRTTIQEENHQFSTNH